MSAPLAGARTAAAIPGTTGTAAGTTGTTGTTAPAPTTGWTRDLPGLAGAIQRALGPALRVADLYSERGSAMYHELTAADTSEIREITRLLRGVGGPVLELACGSGRLTLPMAAAGHDVTGVDLSATMLRLLAGRLAGREGARLSGTVRLIEADILRLRPGHCYAAVVLGTTSVRLFDGDQRRRLFTLVHELLVPGGRFVLSTAGRPTTAADSQDGQDGQDRQDGRDIVTTMALHGSVVTVIQHVTVDGSGRHIAVLRISPDGPPELFTSAVHPVPPDLVQAELQAAGFQIEGRVPVPLPAHLTLGDDQLLVGVARP